MKAWMIKKKTGGLLPTTSRHTKHSCIFWFREQVQQPWTHLFNKGYRCVRVTIKEEK